jgi:hypothetical protein
VIGRAVVGATTMRVETNSVERADALRRRIEDACGGLVRHRLREHTDPLSTTASRGSARPSAPPPPEMLDALRELKERHLEQWLDEQVPALGGKTPRQAARTARGREQVDVLLREMENHEGRMADGAMSDFPGLRARLGIDAT